MIKSPRHPKYIALINWLISVREEQGLTVRELAKLLSEDHSTIVKIETRVRKLSAIEYYEFCSVLNVDPAAGFIAMDKSCEKWS
ncbi:MULTISPECIES: helix-turn-helix domain-containing protein [Amphritea]|uniref:helix-turn-helix domain-containing protein n=1 Tax=Amphritea TaxID=515417 RepID=UPI001C06B8D5|nr:helix-turn-helix transcriptional regulator [Amphritea atlantica]